MLPHQSNIQYHRSTITTKKELLAILVRFNMVVICLDYVLIQYNTHMVGGFSTLFGHFLKSLISHFYTTACKFKVKRSDSQNFGKKNYREGVFRRFSVLYSPGTSFYTNPT